MRSEYCEKDYDELESRIEASESRREAMERFCPPVGAAKSVQPCDMMWHELLTATATLLEEISRRELGDDPATKLANLYREQAAGFIAELHFPPVKFVRGA